MYKKAIALCEETTYCLHRLEKIFDIKLPGLDIKTVNTDDLEASYRNIRAINNGKVKSVTFDTTEGEITTSISITTLSVTRE